MTPPPTVPTVSRRAAVVGLAVAGLGLALTASALPAIAQDATPDATPFPRLGHPLIGAWQHTTAELHTNAALSAPGIGVFHPDGTYLTYESFSGVGIGFWRATGEITADLVVTYQILAGSWRTLAGPEEMFDPGYVPAGHVFEGGTITLTQRIEIDATMNAYMARGTLAVREEDEFVVFSDTASGQAVRMAVIATDSPATPTS
jgi:hypothetical protein